MDSRTGTMAGWGRSPRRRPASTGRRRAPAANTAALLLAGLLTAAPVPVARAEGVALLATIGDAAVAPNLRAAAALDLGATAIEVPGGWYVPVLGDGTGYAVIDEAGGAPMATAVSDLGGLAAVGPPVTRPFRTTDGWIAQAMARVVVGWSPGDNASAILATPDLLRQAGLDDLLGAAGVPIGAPPPRGAADAWHRLSWITDRSIRAAYLTPVPPFRAAGQAPVDDPHDGQAPDLAAIAGPPTSLAVPVGGWRRQRFERAIVEVPADGAATPEIVALGLVLRRATALPGDAMIADVLVGGTVVVRGPVPRVPWRAAAAADWHVSVPATSDAVPLVPGPPIQLPGPLATPVGGVPPTAAPVRPTAVPPIRAPGAAIRVRTITGTGTVEQVIIGNDGTASQDVGGWAVRTATTTTLYRLPAGLQIGPGTSVALLSGRDAPSSPPAGAVTLSRRSLWRDDGGVVILLDRDGQEVDRRAYP